MKKVLVQNCVKGMYLENIGTITAVEIFTNHVALTVKTGILLSAAFYWYVKGTEVYVRDSSIGLS